MLIVWRGRPRPRGVKGKVIVKSRGRGRPRHTILNGVSTAPMVEIQGRQLKLSNLDKVLYPATGFTKGQVIDYYARIGPVLVPHLEGRPLTLKRYPNGVDSQYFFEKNATAHRPDWVKTAPIWSEGNQPHGQLHSGERSEHSGLDGKPGRHRTASLAFFGKRYRVSHHDGVRSRSRTSRQHRAVRAGRYVAAGNL